MVSCFCFNCKEEFYIKREHEDVIENCFKCRTLKELEYLKKEEDQEHLKNFFWMK
jgi:hypothetical protein